MVRTAIVFDHRGRTKKGRPGPLEVRVTSQSKVHYVSTGISVLKGEFRNGVIVNRPDCDELNQRLEILSKAVAMEINSRITNNEPIDVTQIRRCIYGYRDNTNTSATFLDWFAETYPTLPLSFGTKRHYKTVLARLRACAIINRWEDLTTSNIYRFDTYLHSLMVKRSDAATKANLSSINISQGAVYNHHKILKAMISRAVVAGKVQNNPYDRLKGQFHRGDKETVSYLTEEEVAALLSQHPVVGSMMATARDLFIFQLYTGMSYGDMQRFDINDYRLVDGRWINIGQRIKTGTPYVSQLLPPVVDVLERYGMQLPRLENHKYNVCLRALGVAAGISTQLHSHIARHTFATMMLKHGAKIENVSKMLGHTNINQTQRYAKVVAQSVFEDYKKMEKLLITKSNEKDNSSSDTSASDSMSAKS